MEDFEKLGMSQDRRDRCNILLNRYMKYLVNLSAKDLDDIINTWSITFEESQRRLIKPKA